jgi:condensin complex subunit 3
LILLIYYREVRNFIVSNITLNTHTIPHIIKRTRDKDANIRKLVYKQVLVKGIFELAIDDAGEEYQQRGPCHPTNLPLETLETIIKNGLRDRDPAVRAAAALLIDEWVKAFELESVKPEPDVEERAHEGVVELLKLFEVDKRVHEEELGVVEDLLKSVFGMRKGVFEGVAFQGVYSFNCSCSLSSSLKSTLLTEYHSF